MQEELKNQILKAFFLVMRPIVKILFRYGIGYREFAEVAKTAFVDVASTEFGLRGRPTNISRVAVMTGLTRKEVKRIRVKLEDGESVLTVKSTPLADVLHHWHAQPEYLDAAGSPISLPFTGDQQSFSTLVKRFGGDIPAGAMRTEMKRVGVIEELDNGDIRVVNRLVKPDSDHEGLVTVLVHGAYALLSNIAHNSDPNRKGGTWANRFAYTQTLQSSQTGQFRRIAKDRISDFAESVDDLFIAYEAMQADDNKESEDAKPVAVGVFYFEECDHNVEYDW